MYNAVCTKCGTTWEAKRSIAFCPVCNSEVEIKEEKSDTEKQIDEIAKNNSPLSLQVQEAEAHIAVGLAGVSHIIETIEQQRDHLREGAKEFIARGKISDFSFEQFEKFLDNTIIIQCFADRWEIIYPKFINLDLSEIKDCRDLEIQYLGYNRKAIYGELPKWLEHLYNKKESSNESNVEPDNATGD